MTSPPLEWYDITMELSKAPDTAFTQEETEDIKQIAEYLRSFYEIWNICELKEYSYEEILLQGANEFLRRRYVRELLMKRAKDAC